MTAKEVAGRIKKLRTEREVSSVEMSRSLGFYDSYIDQIEQGRIIPTIYDLSQICHYLGTDIYAFLNHENSRSEILIQIYDELEKYDVDSLLKLYYMIKR